MSGLYHYNALFTNQPHLKVYLSHFKTAPYTTLVSSIDCIFISFRYAVTARQILR